MRTLFLLIFLLPLLSNAQHDSLLHKKNYFQRADSLNFNKFNFSVGIFYKKEIFGEQGIIQISEFPFPKPDQQLFKCSGIQEIKPFYANEFSIELNIDLKLYKKFYLQNNISYYRISCGAELLADSIIAQNSYLYTLNFGFSIKNFDWTPILQYRINKYFYPFVGISNTFHQSIEFNYYNEELSSNSNNVKHFTFKPASAKVFGFNFMIPKTNRIYFTCKAVYHQANWQLRKRNAWYSFGFTYFFT